MEKQSTKPDNDNNLRHNSGMEVAYLLILVMLSGILYFVYLGEMALWDTDEALYTQIAREMQQSGDYLSTTWNREPWFCHPPLYFWMTALSARFLGWTEFSARLPSALFGIFTVILVYFLGKLIFNRETGFLAGLITATTLQLWLQSRMAILDMPFLFFVTLGVYFFYRACQGQQSSWWFLGFWASCGLAVLTKGPVGLVLPLFFGACIIVIKKRWDIIGKILLNPGVILFLLISVPWFLGMAQVYQQPFIEQVFDYFFLARIFEPVMNQGGSWYYYIPFFLAGFLPWTAFLPFTLYGLVKGFSDERSRLLLLWTAGTFIMFSLAGTKRPNYILFLYPYLSIAMAWIVVQCFRGDNFRRAFRWSLTGFSLSAVMVIIAFGFAARFYYPQYWEIYKADLTPLGISVIAGGTVTLVLAFLNHQRAFYSVVAVTCVVLLMLISYTPLVEHLRPEPRIGHALRDVIEPGERLVMRGNFGRQFSILYYSETYVNFYHSEDDLVRALNAGPVSYVVLHREEFDRIRDQLTAPIREVKTDLGLILFMTNPDTPHAESRHPKS